MSTLAGKVTTITGLVQVKDPITGAVTTLKQGDEVFAGDIIMSFLDGNITINLINGDLLTLGRDMQMVLNEDVIGTAAMTDSATEGAVDVEALQLAVLQGNFDALEATAAGGEATPNSSANAGLLNTVDRLGLEGEVTSGFDTATAPVVLAEVPDPIFVEPAAVIIPPPPPPEPLCDKEIAGNDTLSDIFGQSDESNIFDFTLVLGGTTCITNFDFSDDAFDFSDLIEDIGVKDNDLDQYLQFENVTIDVDGQSQDKTMITIDSNGADADGDISTIYVDVQAGIQDYWTILVDGSVTEYTVD